MFKEKQTTQTYPPILIVDDDDVILDSLSFFLSQEKWDVVCVASGDEALQKIKEGNIEIVITDINMRGMDGLSLLKKIKEINPDIEVIIMTAYSTEDSAIKSLKAGAFDYFRKPIQGNDVKASLLRTHRVMQLKSQNVRLKALISRISGKDQKHPFIGNSKAALASVQQLKKISKIPDTTVLLSGESGVGKEIAAWMLHHLSKSAEAPFVAINCGGISESLLQRELFGHEKGAFTGAEKRSPGIFEMALGGTVLLDEISELSMSGQSTLLRVLDERLFRRVGGSSEVSLGKTRIIACTNKNLTQMVAEKKFRNDLFFRLNVLHIPIPPLRDRKEDILPLANYYLQSLGGDSNLSFSPQVEKALEEYDYPGNIRELKNIIQHATIFRKADVIYPSDISFTKFTVPTELEEPEKEEVKGSSTDFNLEKIEIKMIQDALKATSYNYSAAARTLCISNQALYRKMEKHNIKR